MFTILVITPTPDFITKFILLFFPNMPPETAGAIGILLCAIIVWATTHLFHTQISDPQKAKANLTAGIMIGGGVTEQQPMQKSNTEKANSVVKTVSTALINPAVPEADCGVEKAIKKAGGAFTLITQAVNLFKLVSPLFKK